MPLIMADDFLGVCQDMRVIHVSGRTGGFKTGLSVAVGQTFLERGYRFVSTLTCVWNTPLEEWTLCDDRMLHTFLVIDEGGLYLQTGKQVQALTAYLSKLDMILFIPSYESPHRRARAVKVRPIYRLFHLGLPLIIYKWWMKPEGETKEDKGYFGWLNPSEVYGIYSRQDPGDDPDAIMETLEKRYNENRQFYGHKTRQITLPSISLLESGGGSFERMANLPDEIEEAADSAREVIEAALARANGKNGRSFFR